ncbi:MAG: cation diffusion facilitator family transporter [Coriobacteriales bacterium]|nr:cation diffusion facilitator family transporter [Coriobacteriales bacterium]
MNREAQIIKASVISIVGNAMLAAVKGVVGTLTGSIAITLDAINSLTDALGSVIAIIGTKLAGMEANREHPFGYGRIEYLSSIVIAALILSAGLSACIESIRSIINPSPSQYTAVTLSIVAGAAIVKFGLGYYLKRMGKTLESGSLIGSGIDSLMDGCVSTATFLAGILFITTGVSIESWLAAGISLLIIKSGISLLLETASKLLGERADPKIVARVEREARKVEEVRLASNVMLLDFGPNRLGGAIHVTVDGQMTVAEFNRVARAVQKRVFNACGVKLAGVTPYPDADADDDEEAREVRAAVARIVWGHDRVVELRGLYIDPQNRIAHFDAIAEYGAGDLMELHDQIVATCNEECPGWEFDARVMPDVGD